MRHLNRVILCVIVFTVTLFAQDIGGSSTHAARLITIDQAVEAALKSNFDIKSDSVEIAIQLGYQEQTRLPENPELSMESEKVGFTNGKIRDGMPLWIQLEQAFQPIYRTKRSMVAKTEVGIAQVNFQKQKRDLIAEVKTRFITAQAFQKIKILADSLVFISMNSHRVSVAQATAGKVAYSDTLKTSAELALALIQRDRDKQSLVIAYQELASLWSSVDVNFECLGNELDSIAILPDSASIFAGLQNAPQYEISIAELDKKRAELALEKALLIPSIRGGAGVLMVHGSSEISPRVSLALTIPFLNWNQGGIKAARYGVLQADFKQSAIKNQIYKDALNTYRSTVWIHHEIQMFISSILPQYKEGLQASCMAYVAGKTNILSLIDAQRSYYQASCDFIESCRKYQFSLIELERISTPSGLTTKTSQKEQP